MTPAHLDKNYVLRFMPGRNASRTAVSAYRRWRFRGGAGGRKESGGTQGPGEILKGLIYGFCFALKMYFLFKKNMWIYFGKTGDGLRRAQHNFIRFIT